MVAIPVLGLSCADVLARTMQLSPNERVAREIGHADVGLFISGGTVTQVLDPFGGFSSNTPPDYHGPQVPLQVGTPAYTALLHRALRIVGAGQVVGIGATYARVGAGALATEAPVQEVDLHNPLTADLGTLQGGHLPASPDQVGITPALASQLDLHIGDPITMRGRSFTVSGIVSSPIAAKLAGVYAVPGTFPLGSAASVYVARTAHPVSWATVQRLNAIGVAALSRAVMQHPPAGVPTTESSNPLTTKDAIGVETVAIGLAILEVTLLAGAAFAVGARRQRHDLALVAAAGGDAGTVRSVVLAGGLVLGVIGAVIGVGLGLALAPAALPFVVHHSGHRAGHFDVRPWEIAGIGVLGVVTGVLAAVLPARSAAREDVVLALSGRRGILRTARRIPAIGVVMIVAGVVIAVAATHNFHFRVILAGAVVAELGFAICAPSLIGVVGRLGRYVSLAPRLALRDAARHRGRSGPAVAAIMAAVAGSIAVSAFFTTSEHDRRADYVASARIGQPYLETTARPGSAAWAQYADVLRHDLGAEGVVPVTRAACVRVHTRCAQFATFSSATSATDIAVGNASMLDVLTGHTDAGAVRALSDGEIVLFDPTRDLPATITDETPTLFVALERASVYHDVIGRSGTPVAGLMTPATAHLLGIRTAPAGMVGLTSTMPTAQQEDRAFEQLPSRVALILDRGYHSNIGVGLLVLALAAAIVTLGATAVAVGLSMAESKPDLITLSAVGGRPVTRRLLVASQAGTVAVLGAAEGVIAGLIPAWAILRSLNRPDFILPWTTIGVVVVGIPLLAMLGTAAFAGSRLTLDRRVS